MCLHYPDEPKLHRQDRIRVVALSALFRNHQCGMFDGFVCRQQHFFSGQQCEWPKLLPSFARSGRPTRVRKTTKYSTLLEKYLATFVYYMGTTLEETREQSASGIIRQLPHKAHLAEMRQRVRCCLRDFAIKSLMGLLIHYLAIG